MSLFCHLHSLCGTGVIPAKKKKGETHTLPQSPHPRLSSFAPPPPPVALPPFLYLSSSHPRLLVAPCPAQSRPPRPQLSTGYQSDSITPTIPAAVVSEFTGTSSDGELFHCYTEP